MSDGFRFPNGSASLPAKPINLSSTEPGEIPSAVLGWSWDGPRHRLAHGGEQIKYLHGVDQKNYDPDDPLIAICLACQSEPWYIGQEPDPCLGRLPGVKYACCGHGDWEKAYVLFENGVSVRRFDLVIEGTGSDSEQTVRNAPH